MLTRTRITLILVSLFLAGCAAASTSSVSELSTAVLPSRTPLLATASPIRVSQTSTGTAAATVTHLPTRVTRSTLPAASTTAAISLTPLPSKTPPSTLTPGDWQNWPVVPSISDHVIDIYQTGLKLGNNPKAFSKIGDCGSTPAWFMGDFDRGSRYYDLGQYTGLQAVIDEFHGSFDRTSLAARSGFNASALFVPLWSDQTYCQPDETPLACEFRNQRPIIVFIMLGTNDIWHPADFEPEMRKIIEFSLNNGTIPILSTKADNQERDGSINATIARLSVEYDIPLWNFWAAVQPLPNHGLQEDGAHLTFGANQFDNPDDMQKAWPVRNLTALQVLDAVWRKMTGQ